MLLVLAAAVAVSAWFVWSATSALPQLDGTARLPGLAASVTVTRDARGVPHITALSLEDLFMAAGYATAQDRLWQMDMTRRYAGGELAEILGPDYLKSDRLQRTLGMRQAAQQAVAAMPDRDRRLLDAYARGVNAYIASRSTRLPVEFKILRYSPRPWSSEDSALVGASFAEMLNLGYMNDMLAREKVTAKIPAELAADLFPMTSWRDHPPAQQEAPLTPPASSAASEGSDSRRGGHGIPTQEFAEALMAELSASDLTPGSNNWVVSGEHTVSGKPLLSNDMHLQHRVPNIWYEIHLQAGDFDVAGVTAPGLPFVVAGHNRRIGWGFTNLNPAAMDLYIENFNATGQYETPSGWRSPERRHEVIHVKGRPDFTFDVLGTRHGPIVSELIPGETRKLALKWTLYDSQALQLGALLDVNAAQDWQQFRRAFSHFGGPGQNVVYGDVDGHIGYQATGFVPVRAAGDATRPVPGNVDTYEWTGYLPFDKMPSVFDPASGIIATANGRITPDGYPYLISAEWMAPHRTDRIVRVLQSNKKFSAGDMLNLQTDIYSDFDRFLAQRFAYAIDHTKDASLRVREAADLLRKWDGRVTADAVAPTIVARGRRHLTQLLLEPLLGPSNDAEEVATGWRQYTWHNSSVWTENLLLHQPQRWLPHNFSSWDALLTSAVDRAVNSPDAPRVLSSWRWGDLNAVYVQHPVFGAVPILRRWSGPGRRVQSGDGTTVKQVGRGFGPSERMTVDFSNLDESTLNIVTGESGNLFSRHYMDQWIAWYNGKNYTLPFSSEAVGKSKTHELRLQP